MWLERGWVVGWGMVGGWCGCRRGRGERVTWGGGVRLVGGGGEGWRSIEQVIFMGQKPPVPRVNDLLASWRRKSADILHCQKNCQFHTVSKDFGGSSGTVRRRGRHSCTVLFSETV